MESKPLALVEPNRPRGKHRHHAVEWRLAEGNPSEAPLQAPLEALALVSQRVEKAHHVQASREGKYEE